ncbi:MAG TPA: hypothetical protein VIM14_00325, partial [Polyangia bacterium]
MNDRSKPYKGRMLFPAVLALTQVAWIHVAQASSESEGMPGEESTTPGAPSDPAPVPSPGSGETAARADEKGASQSLAPADVSATPKSSAPAAVMAAPTTSWFARPSLTLSAGEGAQKFRVTIYGFVEADYIFDTTRSYDDAIGSSLVARSDTYDGRTGRSQFSMRNTRLGFAFESPAVGELKPSAVIEGDFFGHQSSPPTNSEGNFFDSPTFRIRHAFVKLQTPYVDVLMGQTYDVFGWQNYFFPCSAEFLGLPNQLFSRHAQLRLSRGFNSEGAVGVEVAAAAVRPAQRDSEVPDGNFGLRLSANHWKGITTPGNVGTVALPLSVGVSGTVRQFKVNKFLPPPAQGSNSVMGWGISVDALVPIIPATSAEDRGNRLTLIGSFVKGAGIADLITSGGGAKFPMLSNPAQASPPPLYDADIDNGLVSFDRQTGLLHPINWQAFRIGLQYYLPPSGRVLFSANYTQSHSDNLVKLFPQGGSEIELLGSIADTIRYADANLFWDITPAV